ncbi:MAG: ROK family protein [Saprospiraceae bacterium]|nr:ROK family protein [Saprospiraceae bacterium]MCF8249360.1 ROK family protein [Saprospiraceae bacterium]MCF8279012.1 ROK family protein [Bacteroidales bacterium]MCF8311489.1 ROK family protein [Saprospiraceae bacterium]MCF8439979.1 ROK family protein [Saprospiraceae bacterium]
MPIWGIDLGGTKIECAVIESIETRNVLLRKRLPTEQEHGYQHILQQIKKLVETVADEVGFQPDKIGFATPGTLDPKTQTLKNSNTVCLNGMPLKADLESILGVPCELANDANCFALAEAKWGAAHDVAPNAEVVWGIILGTGVGGGVVVNGKVLKGKHGIGGEWGHSYLDMSAYSCYCGNRGCVEQVLSGPALTRFYNEKTGRNLTLPEIVERFYEGNDDAAKATMERLVHFFGKGAANVMNVIDPDVVVIGGGVGNIDLLYTAGVEMVKKFIFNSGKCEAIFLKPKLGDSAGVFGAALLCA